MKRKVKEVVLVEDPHVASRAQYLLLVAHYRELDPPTWTLWTDTRDRIIQTVLEHTPVLSCSYCSRTNLLPNIGSKGRHPNMATLDHLMPKSRGGSNDLTNLVISCSPCNSAKSNDLPTLAQRACIRVSDIVGMNKLPELQLQAA